MSCDPMQVMVSLKDRAGTLLDELMMTRENSLYAIEAAIKVNDVGAFVMTLPPTYNPAYLQRDNRVEIRYSMEGERAQLFGERYFLIRSVEWQQDTGGAIEVRGVCLNDLLTRRIIAAYSGSTFSKKSGAADDVMKALVRENCTAAAHDYNGAAAIRAFDNFAVQADTGLGAPIDKTYAHSRLLEKLAETASASALAGTFIAFDVVYVESTGVREFRTYAGKRGVDRRHPSGVNPVVLSAKRGNLGGIRDKMDYSNAFDFVYCGGQGEEDNRVIKTSPSPAPAWLTADARVERFIDARQSSDPLQVQTEADARLQEGRATRTVTANIIEAPGTRFGRDFGFGDVVTVESRGEQFDARVDAVKLSVKGGRYDISCALRAERTLDGWDSWTV